MAKIDELGFLKTMLMMEPHLFNEVSKRIEKTFEPINICESPIEKLMFLGLYETFWKIRGRVDMTCTLSFQKEITCDTKKYRVDFYLAAFKTKNNIEQSQVFIIECDGHDFHEKTKEQAKRDKQKDRELQKLGYKILRFTGSEIWENHIGCGDQVHNIIMAHFKDGEADAKPNT